MGRTVAELDATLTPAEFREWQVYFEFEPFGAPAEDDRWRLNYSLFFSAHAKANTQQPEWLDRDPEETQRIREAQKMAVIESFFESRIAQQAQAVKPPSE